MGCAFCETGRMGLLRNLSVGEIVGQLDAHIVGQADAKRAVAIALRNRWRRLNLPPIMRKEVQPKNYGEFMVRIREWIGTQKNAYPMPNVERIDLLLLQLKIYYQ